VLLLTRYFYEYHIFVIVVHSIIENFNSMMFELKFIPYIVFVYFNMSDQIVYF